MFCANQKPNIISLKMSQLKSISIKNQKEVQFSPYYF